MNTKSSSRLSTPRHFVGYFSLIAWLMAILVAGLRPSLSFGQETITLVGAGSTVPAPLYTKWAEEYNKRNPKIQMRYLSVGTSDSINQVSQGTRDFGAGEAQLTLQERSAGSLVALPSVVIGIVPIYNLPGIHADLNFSGELLADIYLGRVKNWNDPPITKLNPAASLPDLPIKVVYRPPGKGTNYVFSEFLSKTSASFRAEIGTSLSPKWPVGTPAETSLNMAEKVKIEAGSIGYLEAQYANKTHIPHGKVLNSAGRFVKATADSIAAACRAVEAPRWEDFSASLTNAPGDDSFPITSFTWLYLRTNSANPRRAPALADLLNWMYNDGQELVVQEGYSDLPKPLLTKVRNRVASLR